MFAGRRICHRLARTRTFATEARNQIRIVEVGPRDGLQNEKGIIPFDVKLELVRRLGRTGLNTIEAGSFVSPKWVPQMAGTAELLAQMERLPGVHYPVLVPNQRGLDNLLAVLDSATGSGPPPTDEISIFVAATEEFSKANLNTSIAESMARLRPVTKAALDRGLRVRGYVSVAISCPFSGQVDYTRVREISQELVDMGCYEISVCDTVGTAQPHKVSEMLEEVKKSVPVGMLAEQFHDTYGTAVANILAALDQGVRVVDSSVGGLGGCPYSPGATGNVATEDVLYALQDSKYSVEGNVDVEQIADIGWWISEKLGRESVSRVGRALRSKKLREQSQAKL
ncbi:hypothetical protein C8J56DRAFT_820491 [Mycena floridula]|nr:hypothetical protein C8J56DRAFT_820491 [Mycena floridula]